MIAAAAWLSQSRDGPGDRVERIGPGRGRARGRASARPWDHRGRRPRPRNGPRPGADALRVGGAGRTRSLRGVRLLRTTQQAESDLRAAERQFRALVQRSSDAALVLGPDGTIQYASPAVQDQFGYRGDELLGRIGWELSHPDDLERALETFGAIADRPGAHASTELRIRDGAGRWRWVEEVVTNLLDDPGVHGLVANVRDISSRKAAEERLDRLAHYDPLTGLPNRWMLMERLASELAAEHPSVALLIIDLDQFKFVNDSRGHGVGDALLAAVAERLAAGIAEGDTIARIGGDEFAVICREVEDPRRRASASRLRGRALDDPIVVPGGGTFEITASVGIACRRMPTTRNTSCSTPTPRCTRRRPRGSVSAPCSTRTSDGRHDEHLTVQSELRERARRRPARRALPTGHQPRLRHDGGRGSARPVATPDPRAPAPGRVRAHRGEVRSHRRHQRVRARAGVHRRLLVGPIRHAPVRRGQHLRRAAPA